MPTTGTDISRDFDRVINASYSVYAGGARRTTLFKDSLIDMFEYVYKHLQTGDYYDKLRYFISLGNSYQLTNNTIITQNITDYYHLLGVKFTIQDVLANYSMKGVKINNSTGVITITFNNKTPLRGYAGFAEQLLLSNFCGYTQVLAYVKQMNDYNYELYSDEFYKNPLLLISPFDITNASAIRIVKTWAKPLRTETKGMYYGSPTIYFPKYEIGDGLIRAYPENYPITDGEFDFLRLPIWIDPTDNSFDYETVYPVDAIKMFVDFAAKRYFEETKDFNSVTAKITTDIVND